MDEYIKKYLNYLLYQKKYSKNTVLNYEEDLTFFKEYLNKEKIDVLKVDYALIRSFYNYMEDFSFSKNTISRKISSIRSFINT